MLEFLFEMFGEFLLQVLGEVLLELGLHSVAEPFRRKPNPWLATIGYAIFGGIAGGLSLLLLPKHLMPAGPLRIVNLLLTPVVAGLCMALMGRWRAKRGDDLMRIDKFAYGYLFALTVALIRFYFAE